MRTPLSNTLYMDVRNVKNNLCDFEGKIIVDEICETHREQFGVDNEHKGKSKMQGILTARYEIFKSKTAKHTGVFTGILHSKWYLDSNDAIKYDDINSFADGYFNNSFVGYDKCIIPTQRKYAIGAIFGFQM